jgi:pimeloyl-ACP methyl ester carboxylesterase
MPEVPTKFAGPSMLIAGENSPLTIKDQNWIEQLRLFTQYFTETRYEVIPNCGHHLHEEKPVVVSEVITAFINDEPPVTTRTDT